MHFRTPIALSALIGALASCAANSAEPMLTTDVQLQAILADSSNIAPRIYRASEVARPVATASGNPVERWPDGDGCAVLLFVVDTTGRLEQRTLAPTTNSSPHLVAAVARLLPRWRFLPAERQPGERVRQLTELTVRKRGNGVTLTLATDPGPHGCSPQN